MFACLRLRGFIIYAPCVSGFGGLTCLGFFCREICECGIGLDCGGWIERRSWIEIRIYTGESWIASGLATYIHFLPN